MQVNVCMYSATFQCDLQTLYATFLWKNGYGAGARRCTADAGASPVHSPEHHAPSRGPQRLPLRQDRTVVRPCA